MLGSSSGLSSGEDESAGSMGVLDNFFCAKFFGRRDVTGDGSFESEVETS